MKTLYLHIILVGCVASVGLFELSWILVSNSQETLSLRFSHSFFTIFTLIPFSIIGVGLVTFWLVFAKKYDAKIKSQMILFGSMVILVGIETFGMYLLD
jgi:hypothetical protein